MTTDARRGRSRELAVAAAVAAVLAVGAFLAVRYVNRRHRDDAVASTLRKVKADAARLRAGQFDRVRTASLEGGPGGIVDVFHDVGRPNHVAYPSDAVTVEFPTGAEASRGCVIVTLRRDSASYATGRCSPGRD